MQKLLTCGVLMTLTACAIAAQSPTLKADHRAEGEQQLLKTERDWLEALKSHDKQALTQLCADDFFTTDEEGKVSKKAKYLEDSLQHLQITSSTLSELFAQTYGETGIVSGRWKAKFTVDGVDASGTYQFTDTFVRRDGRWWAVTSHASRVPPDQP